MSTEQNQTEISFDELLSMGNFSLDDNPTPEETPEFALPTDNEEEEEEKVIEEKEKPEAKVEEKEPKLTLTNTSTYGEVIKDKLESGEWEDVKVELPDGTEKLLSELGDVDKETFKTLESVINAEKEVEFNNKYVSIDGLDETQKKLINIIKEGDLDKARELFENPQALSEPFQGYDDNDEGHQEQVLSWYYSSILKHSPKETQALVNAAKEDLSLDTKANQIVAYQRNQFQKALEKQESDLRAEKEREIENIKEFRKTLSSEFKSENLSDNLTRKFVDAATKKNSEGSYEIDSIYDEWMSDPKKAKELIYFLLDKDNYVKKITSEVKRNVQINDLKTIKLVQDTTKVAKTKKEEDTNITPFDTLTLE